MVQLTLNFNQFDPSDEPYGNQAWITLVKWRNVNNAVSSTLLSTKPGVYIIDNGERPIYAGQATNIRGRFDGRSGALNDFGLTATDNLVNYRVWSASITANPVNYESKVDWAERWLVRFLYLNDLAQPPRMLQNINLTLPLTFSPDGINIRFDPDDVPEYLLGGPGYKKNNASSAGYNYAANSVL